MNRYAALIICFVDVLLSPARADYLDDVGQAPYEQCGYCHEIDGNPQPGIFPRLAGQQSAYLIKQLEDFRAGTRVGPMQATAELLSDEEIQIVADYFNKQQVVVPQLVVQDDPVKQIAKRLFVQGDATRGLTACSHCHGVDGLGEAGIPRLSGQHEAYLLVQLSQFRSGARSNDIDGQMRAISAKLSPAEINVLARFLAEMPASSKYSLGYKNED